MRRRRETSKKGNIIAIVTVLCVAGLILLLTHLQSPDAYGTCTIGVECKSILSNTALLNAEKADYLPPEGVLLAGEAVGIYEGDTVLAVLERAVQTAGIALESEEGAVIGIGDICAGDCGAASCWKYRVNGTEIAESPDTHTVEPNDTVKFFFTCG